MLSNHVQRTPEGAAAALLLGPDFLSSTGTHRNLSAVSPVGGRQAGAAPVVSSGRGGTGCVVRTGAAPVVSSGRGGARHVSYM